MKWQVKKEFRDRTVNRALHELTGSLLKALIQIKILIESAIL